MALGGTVWRVVRGSGVWLYCRLRIFFYWLVKVGGNSAIRFRRWLRKSRQKKSLLKLGQAIHQLHLEGRTAWSDDIRTQEIIRDLEDCAKKRERLETRLQEREAHYLEQVKRIKDGQSSRLTESEGESTAGSGQQTAGSQ